MNRHVIRLYLSYILFGEGLFLLPALGIALFRGERAPAAGICCTMAVAAALSLPALLRKKRAERIYVREGFVIVSLGWVAISLVGALPFYISGAIPSFLDSWFETVSGFTTTGSSILTDVEALPYSLLYWRSFTHWLGGMGVLVFMLALIPLAKGQGETMHLLSAESPGPAVDKLAPTMRRSVRILYTIYVAMTAVLIVLLLAGGMPLFDSVVHAFGTAGTGGFSMKNASIAAYDSAYLQAVIAVFMALFGVNFSVYYLLLLGRLRAIARGEELRVYLGIILAATAAIALSILPAYAAQDRGRALLDSFFQVTSIVSTTGYATVDFNQWPEFSRFILMLLMIVGASAGSTAGGFKVSRLILLFKSARSRVQTLLHPRALRPVRMDGAVVEDSVLQGAHAFLVVYAAISLLSMLILSLDGHGLETTITAVLSCVNNIGPGLGMVGPTGNFSAFSPLSKMVLSFDMLLGRLEFFPILILAMPSVWRRRI